MEEEANSGGSSEGQYAAETIENINEDRKPRESGRERGRGGGNGSATPTGNESEQATVTEAPTSKEFAGGQDPPQRGPPEDGIPSKTKVKVTNLPYDLTEEKVCHNVWLFIN